MSEIPERRFDGLFEDERTMLEREATMMRVQLKELSSDNASLRQQLAEAVELLKRVEYIHHEYEGVNEQPSYCPFCFAEAHEDEDMRHKPDCQHAAFLTKQEQNRE